MTGEVTYDLAASPWGSEFLMFLWNWNFICVRLKHEPKQTTPQQLLRQAREDPR